MARKKFTTKKPGAGRAPSPPPSAATAGRYSTSPLGKAVETERHRLMSADAVMACAQIALDPLAVNPGPEPYLPAVLTIARGLINKSIDHLDSVELGRLTRKPRK